MSIKDVLSTARSELATAQEQLIAAYGGVSPPIEKFIAATVATIYDLGAWEEKYAATLRVGQALVSDEVFHQRAVVESLISDPGSTLTRQWRIERGADNAPTIRFRMRINQGEWLYNWKETMLNISDLMTAVTRIIPAPDVEP